MRMNVNPLTGQVVDSKRRLVFDEVSMSYISLGKGEKLIRNPLKPREIFIGRKLTFNPLEPNKVVLDQKLAFNPLEGRYIGLKKGEKLRFDHEKCKYIVKRTRKLVEWLKLLLSPKEK